MPGPLARAWHSVWDWLDQLRYYSAADRSILSGLFRRISAEPEVLAHRLELARFHAARGDFERAARVLARLAALSRELPECRLAAEEILREGMRRLVQVVARSLVSLRLGQAITRLESVRDQLVSLHDLLFQEVLEVRELLFRLRLERETPTLEVLHLRASLPDWRLSDYLTREAGRHRDDVRDFHVSMEEGRVRVRCYLKGIPVVLQASLAVTSPRTIRVQMRQAPRLFFVLPLPRSEVARVIESMAGGLPPGFLSGVTAEGFDLDFGALLHPLHVDLNLRHIEIIPGEVRSVAGADDPVLAGRLPGPAALLEQAGRHGVDRLESLALASEAEALERRPPGVDLSRGTGGRLEVPAGPTADRIAGQPFDPEGYRKLARLYHSRGESGAARLAFEAVHLLLPSDREAAEYLRAASGHPRASAAPAMSPDALERLRCPEERAEPVRTVLGTLVRELGWPRRSAVPAGAEEVEQARYPLLAAARDRVGQALGLPSLRLLISTDTRPGAAAPDVVWVPRQARALEGEEEATFLVALAAASIPLHHLGLLEAGPADRAVLGGLVHQIAGGRYRGGHLFRPIRTLDAWLPPRTVEELRADCRRLLPRMELEMASWLGALRTSRDRLALALSGSLRAAVSGILRTGGGPGAGKPLEQLAALSPDHTVRERCRRLLDFAVLELARGGTFAADGRRED